ncbi:MAG: filamentous hemagglutinin N-terminal domain-containing protein [Candidatus Eremiobacteraeota bacterium]|nr:filamentous hemagglutinin N-terminal domain-containing protein [Candidatus Eremiobacteraeota bacterium]
MRRLLPFLLLCSSLAFALPTDPQVTNGQATVQQAGSQMIIRQGSDRAIIEWNGFSISVGELVRFVQPGQLSAILNRVVGTDPSLILGALQANGQVFLVNPNGVFFAPGSQVDVGSLVVSTLNLTDQDFLAGAHTFTQGAGPLAAVINQGTLKVSNNGFVILASPLVANQGLVVATGGKVVLAGGERASVSFDPNGLVAFEVARAPSDQGPVLLPVGAVNDVLGGVIAGHDPGLVIIDGEIRAQQVVADSTSATIATAAAALSGQKILLLSQGLTSTANGSRVELDAGGMVEVSGQSVVVGLDVSAPLGGTFLIDPPTLTVADGPKPMNPAADTVYEETIENSGADVVLMADDAIVVEDISDDEIVLQPNRNLTMTTVNANEDGVFFDDPFDTFVTSGSGTVVVNSASGISGGGFASEQPVTLSAAEDIDEVYVEAPSLTAAAGGDALLYTDVDEISVEAGGEVEVTEGDSLVITSLVAGYGVSVIADGDIEADPMSSLHVQAGDDSELLSVFGTVGSVDNPIVVDIDGDLDVAGGDEVNGVSATVEGSVSGLATVAADTPGSATLNGQEILALSEPLDFELTDEELIDLALEFGLTDDEIFELFEQLGESAQSGFLDGFEFGEEGPQGPPEPGEGPGAGPGKPGQGPGPGKPIVSSPGRVAQAGLGAPPLSLRALMDMSIAQYQQVTVMTANPSPFDIALEQDQLTADAILDLDPDELGTLPIGGDYNLARDLELMAPNLTADDILDLKVGELGDIPVGVGP